MRVYANRLTNHRYKDVPKVYKSVEKPLKGRERLKTVIVILFFLSVAMPCIMFGVLMRK